MSNFGHCIQFHIIVIHSNLPSLFERSRRKSALPGMEKFADALRLIHSCLKLFVSVWIHFVNCCAVSFRTEILRMHAEYIRRRIRVYAP
jgi:hypothetical protein